MADNTEHHPCALSPEGEPPCRAAAVVAIEDRHHEVAWGCEPHAGPALNGIEGARVAQVADWSAVRRLLALPWNHRLDGLNR